MHKNLYKIIDLNNKITLKINDMRKTILVTGGCGFIGSHFIDLLIEHDYNVINIDNLTYAASGDKAYSREKLEVFFEGNTLVCEDYRISKRHFGGKTETFKTRGQQMGYQEELSHFALSVKGQKSISVNLNEAFDTMRTVFAIESSLASGKSISLS